VGFRPEHSEGQIVDQNAYRYDQYNKDLLGVSLELEQQE
jgi:hypothetical protein